LNDWPTTRHDLVLLRPPDSSGGTPTGSARRLTRPVRPESGQTDWSLNQAGKVRSVTWFFVSAIGGIRTPNLLIRRDLHRWRPPAYLIADLLEYRSSCAPGGGVERCCVAKMRPP
jgi:hypothetical protein